MKITVLIDNISKNIKLAKEWGLSVFVENDDGKRVLLDCGASGFFVRNAKELGVDLSRVDAGVLSHAHFDHSNGLKKFFGVNSDAKFYLRDCVNENCYHTYRFFYKYIGIKRGWLKKYNERFSRAGGDFKLFDNVYLVPHKTEGLEAKGRAAHLSVKLDGKFMPDEEVLGFGERLKELDVQKIYTGHCTGQHAYELLHGVLGERVEQLYTGMEIEV